MKKYTYYFKDLDLRIQANTGDEAMREFSKVTNKPFNYNGIIELTDNVSKVVDIIYPIKVI